MTKMDVVNSMLEKALQDKKISRINDFLVITDKADYPEMDQVIPLFPEQQFFLDEIVVDKINGAEVLEIGVGSGVLSIGAIKAGAKRVTALEINPRAKIFAGFNIMLNGLEGQIEIADGDRHDIWKPVAGKQFDYLISNPPFEPTPPDTEYFLHSASGLYGLDFVETLFRELDDHLFEKGHGQIVTGAPGNEKEPFMLLDLANQYLPGITTVKVEPDPLPYDEALEELFTGMDTITVAQVENMKEQAKKEGVSHWHLCVLHYEKGPKTIKVQPSIPYF
ncbi:MAG: methyltransferase [Candidatus Parabeggiatoa sp. nov. 2]|nr:MAG: hypothetical protein B6247_10135 [Beggiatoa sp. 4572_84]RKZ58317.1 MAG: methyltransferase [Gammaproteobacteria bacterium]